MNEQLDYLAQQQKQLAENVKVVAQRADKLNLRPDDFIEALKTNPLSNILQKMDHAADEVAAAVKRREQSSLG